MSTFFRERQGSRREKEYFQQLEGLSKRVVVEYIEDEQYKSNPPSSPLHVLRRAEDYVRTNDLNDEDSIWLVMDVDRWGGKTLSEVHDSCLQKANWHVVLSNPCFEIWLLYHTVEDLSNLRISTGKDCKMSLDEQSSGGYDPKRYIVLINNAIANAKVADKSKGWFPGPGNTKIYELAESLMKFVSVREFNDFVERMRSDLG